ncbi:MAG: hypothetical protein JOY81_11930 [Alphaproteobacteria bacterium]|nr:hypothetical protein [Alphaproteobacteria bacterium]
MTDHDTGQPENLTLVMLRRIDQKLDRVLETLHDHAVRLTRLDESNAGTKKDLALQAEHFAHIEVRMDRIVDRLSVIEKRLGLVDA